MAWYFNFCAPSIPNDPTINFHRYFQTGCLLVFMIIYVIAHAYFKIFNPDLLEEKQVQSESSGNDGSSQNDKGSDESEEQNNQKSVSIAGGLNEQDENSSYVTFTTKDEKKKNKKKKNKKKKFEFFENVTSEELESYFPIVFGHFAIACASSIMYSPYAEQSIATVLYIILGCLIGYLNVKRKIKGTRVVWGFMCFLVFFLIMSALLEVGQSNYNKIEKQCFSVGYKALY